jgi:hypothetical protein
MLAAALTGLNRLWGGLEGNFRAPRCLDGTAVPIGLGYCGGDRTH